MSEAAQRALFRAVKERAFDPVYYFFGDDDFLKEEAARQLVASAVDPATRDFNYDVRRGPELDAETVASLLGTPPMMADRRVVVLRDADGMKKDARAALERYLERPASDLVLVILTAAEKKADKKLSASTTAVEFPPLKPERVAKWIEHHAHTELGVTITPEAAALLQCAVGNDLPLLTTELDKLASYTNGAPIDEQAVTAVVGVRRGETLGDLLDRILARDAAGALSLLPHVLQQPKVSAVPIIMALTAQMLAVGWAGAARAQGMSAGRIEGELFGLLKGASSTFTGRPWGQATKAWAAAAPRWSAVQIDRALDALLAADASIKESRLSSDEDIVTTLVLALCTA